MAGSCHPDLYGFGTYRPDQSSRGSHYDSAFYDQGLPHQVGLDCDGAASCWLSRGAVGHTPVAVTARYAPPSFSRSPSHGMTHYQYMPRIQHRPSGYKNSNSTPYRYGAAAGVSTSRPQGYIPRAKDYIHENSFFMNSQRPYRGSFIIHPEWISETKLGPKDSEDKMKRGGRHTARY